MPKPTSRTLGPMPTNITPRRRNLRSWCDGMMLAVN
jgi:hypothetical protein